MKFQKPIFISLSPNIERDDLFLVLQKLFQPWNFFDGPAIKELEESFKKYLNLKYAFSFNSGRSAFLAILKSLSLKEEDEILLQAFTCNALVNPILALNLKPIFVDIEKSTLNLDPQDLKKKITPKSKVVVVQHTFGLPAKMEEILKICLANDLILIEDCAHCLGATLENKKLGTFGKAAFFSFGRDKIISSVSGGMAVTNDPVLGERLKEFQAKCSFPSYFWTLRELFHPVLTQGFIKPLYRFFGIGKWFLIFFQKLEILSKAVSKEEKKGKLSSYFPKKLPNVLACLALNQLKKLKKFNCHRKKIAKIYDEELKELNIQLPLWQTGRVYMRYPLILENKDTDEILRKFEKEKIFLDDGWRKTPIVPPDTDQTKMHYKIGSCPNAEKVAKFIINLPTHIQISEKDAQKIVNLLKQFFK